MQNARMIILLGLIIIFSMNLNAQGFRGGERKPPDQGDRLSAPDNHDNGRLEIREFQGYLVDCIYGKAGLDETGRNIIKKPGLITLNHLKSKESIEAGYGIYIQTPGHDNVFFRFDKSGNLKTEDYLLNTCKKKNKIFVQVKGYLDMESHTISVIAIEQTKSTNQSYPAGQHPRPGNGDRLPDMPGFDN